MSGQAHQFPSDILLTRLRPDLVLVSRSTKVGILGELTVPWEDNVEEAYERKYEKYEELILQCEERGWI